MIGAPAPEEYYQRVVVPYGLVGAEFAWGDIFTALFLHANLLHLLVNVLFLYVVGDDLEDLLGHAGYLGCYLLSGAAAMLVYAWTRSGGAGASVPCIGASGAVAGMLALFVVLLSARRFRFAIVFPWFGPLPWVLRPLVITFSVRSIVAVGYWLVLQLVVLVVVAATGSVTGPIDVFGCNAWGFVAGLAIAALLGVTGVADASGFSLIGWVLGERPGEATATEPTGWQEAERPRARSRLDAFRPDRPPRAEPGGGDGESEGG